ncbi:hypothetical protein FH063_001006 [Azospirillum argentinense]|uniref:Uncharacterized protein n=1 Tax=Azospirillum argentinense TaxID=2970906 RepID=A0A5B0L455_9PROT|nr:hypothetical protein FH063_001006 [Azospirillum argentinense]
MADGRKSMRIKIRTIRLSSAIQCHIRCWDPKSTFVSI